MEGGGKGEEGVSEGGREGGGKSDFRTVVSGGVPGYVRV